MPVCGIPLTGRWNRRATDHYTALRWLVHWPLMGGLLHLVQRGGAWAGWGPAQSPHRCTKCNSPPINGQCIPTSYYSMWHYNCQCPLKGYIIFLHKFHMQTGYAAARMVGNFHWTFPPRTYSPWTVHKTINNLQALDYYIVEHVTFTRLFKLMNNQLRRMVIVSQTVTNVSVWW